MNELAIKLILDSDSIVLLGAGFLNLALALYLFQKDSKVNELSKKYIAYATFFVSVWLFSSWINHFVQSEIVVTVSSRLSYASAIVALFFLIFFALVYQNKRISLIYSILAISLSMVVMATPLVIERGISASAGTKESAIFGQAYQFWSATIFSLVVFLVFQLLKSYRCSVGIKKERMKYIFTFFIISILLVLIFNLVLPNLGNTAFMFVGQYATFIFATGVGWSILQERIYSISYAFANSLAIITSGSILFLLSWGTQKFEQVVLSWDITNVFSINVFILGLTIACSVALFIDRLTPKLRKIFYSAFGLNILTLESIQSWLLDKTNLMIDLNDYIDEFLENLKGTMLVDSSFLYIFKTSNFWATKGTKNIDPSDLLQYQKIKTVIIQDQNEKIGLIVPLFIENKTYAILVLGQKISGSFYSKEELQYLKNIVKVLLVAVNRYILYEDEKNFNQTLQLKVQQATADLKEKNKQLEFTLRKERDMLDILGHELRTPLTIGKNAMKVMKQKHAQGKLDGAILAKYLDIADENLSREAKLLETLLSTTKIDNQALDLHLEKVDLLDVIGDSLRGMQPKAAEKKLEIKYVPIAKADIYADRNRMQEVVDNLIDNAIKYTDQGHVEIIIDESSPDFIKLSVKDTGRGIPKDQLDKLGQKFYRVNTYLDSSKDSDYQVVRPGGTGLGLYVTFSLIRAMGGQVQVTSEIDKGSVFSITIPKFTGQVETGVKDKRDSVFEKFEKMKKEKEDKVS